MKISRCVQLVLLVALCLAHDAWSQSDQENRKIAQTGLGFLSVVSDGRAAAIGDAVTATEMGSSSLFFNPAGMANLDATVDLTASMNQWIADINYNTFSLAIRPKSGQLGVVGFTLQSVDYGDLQGTRYNPTAPIGYDETGDFSPSAFAFGVGYSKAISDRFSVGGQVKWVRQDLGESVIAVGDSGTDEVSNEVKPLAFDFGTQFKTGVKSLAFGMSIRDFSREIKYADEGFQLPLVFRFGVSMNLADVVSFGNLSDNVMVSVDATHYRSHPEQLKVGVDCRVLNMLSLRGGYTMNNDEDGVTFGVGLSQFGFAFDYAYTPFGIFDNVQRMTARFSF